MSSSINYSPIIFLIAFSIGISFLVLGQRLAVLNIPEYKRWSTYIYILGTILMLPFFISLIIYLFNIKNSSLSSLPTIYSDLEMELINAGYNPVI